MKYYKDSVYKEIMDELNVRIRLESGLVDGLYNELCLVAAEDKDDKEVLNKMDEIITNMRCRKARLAAYKDAVEVFYNELSKAREFGEYVVKAE